MLRPRNRRPVSGSGTGLPPCGLFGHTQYGAFASWLGSTSVLHSIAAAHDQHTGGVVTAAPAATSLAAWPNTPRHRSSLPVRAHPRARSPVRLGHTCGQESPSRSASPPRVRGFAALHHPCHLSLLSDHDHIPFPCEPSPRLPFRQHQLRSCPHVPIGTDPRVHRRIRMVCERLFTCWAHGRGIAVFHFASRNAVSHSPSEHPER